MEAFLKQILSENNIEPNKLVNQTITKLVDNAKIAELAKSIVSIKNQIIEIFMIYKNKEEFKEKHIVIANANAKKEYDFTFDLQEFPNIAIKEIKNLDIVGLQFDPETNQIFGTPTVANTVNLDLVFYSKTDEKQSTDIKTVPFIVNADPKDLWKDKASDKNLKYAKEDHETYHGHFLDKKIVVASQRGRSHAHDGLFRDDDFKVQKLWDDWTIVAVADGAGSAKYARQGSRIATEFIVESFNNEEILQSLSNLATNFYAEKKNVQEVPNADDNPTEIEKLAIEEQSIKTKSSIVNILYKNVRILHTQLIDFAKQEAINLKDLNTTLIFALVKKFDFGYVMLTFGVGDCPINIITKDFDEVKLLNTLDIGEFGGGTRFITMPEVFSSPNMGTRFGIHKLSDFSKLFLMTDGIYDPKFETENKLEDLETWKAFIQDLNGKNEDKIKVDFENDEDIQEQLLKWMNFWSKGNHDDRTLAIIY
ncbi:PP2C family serine/threonine-protein phosphatase [Pedobacter sp. Du54]|uniref:PP2C family serine/threonine-protein phosphatase n=1 Tax=Pedobacter anseongensis TaxID=3133439 RepID=UPI00309E97E0